MVPAREQGFFLSECHSHLATYEKIMQRTRSNID